MKRFFDNIPEGMLWRDDWQQDSILRMLAHRAKGGQGYYMDPLSQRAVTLAVMLEEAQEEIERLKAYLKKYDPIVRSMFQ